MRNPLNKRLPRLLMQEPSRYLPLFLLLIVTIILLSSFFISQGSVKDIYYDHLEQGKVEDGQFTTVSPIRDATRKKLEACDVRLYENFYVECRDGTASLNIYKVRDRVNLPVLIEGDLPRASDEIALDDNYSRFHHYRIGDMIALENQHFRLVGTVVLPDYVAMMKNRNDLVMDTFNFGVGLVSTAGFDSLQEHGVQYNYAYREEKPSADKKEANDKLKELTNIVYRDNILTDAATRAQNKRISYLIDDMGGDVPMMYMVLVLTMLSIAFVFTMQTKNLIESESSVIGTLLASGFRKSELLFHYMLLPFLSVLLAALAGNILTYAYLYRIYQHIYYSSFSLPTFHPVFHPRAFLLTTLIPAALILSINLFMLLRYFSLTPLSFLRHDLHRQGKISEISLPGRSFLARYRWKVLLTNKLQILILLFGVSLASIFLCFGLGLRPIFEHHAEMMMNEFPARYQTYVREAVPAADGEKFAAASFDLSVKGECHPFALYGISKESRYFDSQALEKLAPHEIQASEGLVKKFDLEEGDRIEVFNPYTGNRYTFTIRSVRPDAVSLSAYMPIAAFNEVMGYDPAYFSGYFSDSKLAIDKAFVISRVDREVIGEVAEHFLENFGSITPSILFLSILFYFVFIYLLSKSILDKARTDICYLKIFGFTSRESAGVYLGAIGWILGLYLLFLPWILKHFMVWMMKVSMKKFDAYMAPVLPSYVYLTVVIAGILLFALVQILQRRRIGKINMVEVLKDLCG